jgi:anaerobic selenocysteine-containing dehydrogenase
VDPELFGGPYNVGGGEFATPAFQLYRDHLAQYSTQWADGICDLPTLTVARIARELFENSNLQGNLTPNGEIDVDGVTLPYRPVSMMAYHVSQQELGFSAVRAAINVFQLLGAIDVPGGIQVDFGPSSLYKNWDGLNNISIKTDNLSYDLGKSKFFPISSGCPSFFHRVQFDPARYDVDETTIPKKVIIHMADPAKSFTDLPVIRQAYSQFEHVTVLTPWMSETASLYGDLLLPAATLEKYEGPISCSTPDEKADALRLPPVTPLWESKGEIDIYLDIAEKVGFLDLYLDKINSNLSLAPPVGPAKPTPREIFDNWAQTKGLSGIDYFEANGVTDTSTRDPDGKYTYAMTPPYHGARHRLYGEKLLEYGETMAAAGIDSDDFPHIQDYTEFPTWREPTMWGSIPTHPLCLLSHKQIEFKQSRASFVPYLAEIAPSQGLLMNPQTAGDLGIADGDEIFVESHNAMTDETRQVRTRAVLHASIRPDTVSMSHHYGLNVTPTNQGQGPSPNELYFSGEGYIQCTQDASFHVMVRVTKA